MRAKDIFDAIRVSKLEHKVLELEKMIRDNKETHLQDFNKLHYAMVEKYFDCLEKSIRLIDSYRLSHEDFTNLKREFLGPIIKRSWEESEKKEAKKIENIIKTFGQRILAKRKELHDRMIIQEKEGKSVSRIKGVLEGIDYIIKGAKDEKFI